MADNKVDYYMAVLHPEVDKMASIFKDSYDASMQKRNNMEVIDLEGMNPEALTSFVTQAISSSVRTIEGVKLGRQMFSLKVI